VIAYIVRRLVGAAALVVIISAVTFSIFFLLPRLAGTTTDDLASRFAGKSPTPETVQAIKERFGFDDPVPVQYARFLKGVVAGSEYDTGTDVIDCPAPCFGYSFRDNINVTDVLLDRIPVTLSLVVGAAVLWLLAGVSIGVLSALRKGTVFDRAAMLMALAGVSLPIFFTGLLSLTFIVHQWDLLPPVSYHSFLDNPFKWAGNLILPWVTLSFLYAAMYARMTRAGMLDTMNEDYIRTARAKGLPEKTVITKHALRGTLTPLLTMFGMDIGLLLGGAVLTESTFSLHGLGELALAGVIGSDLPVVLGVVSVAALFVVLANLVVDLLYGVVDPRVRHN